MNRRKFLEGSALSVGSLSAGVLTLGPTSNSSGQELKPMKKKHYRVGIIGSTGKGNYGHGLDVVWKNTPGVAVVAVADDHERGLAKAIGRTKAKKGYRDYREMLAKEKPDIVAVCPRWIDRHHEMVMQCAMHGCHVYMEKPFVRTLEEADDIVQAFEAKNLKLAIAHGNRFRPELQIVRRLISGGELGKILELRARGKEDRRGGGEDLWVLGTHMLDLMRALVDAEMETCYATVTTEGRPVTKADVYDGNEGIGPLAGDAIDATYRFRNGVPGYFASHRNQRGDRSRFQVKVFGARGVIEFPSDGRVHVLQDAGWSTSNGDDQGKWVPIEAFGTPDELKPRPMGNEAAVLDLIAAIEEGRQTLSSVYDARAATEMIAAVFESHRLGTPVAFPLENRKNPLTML